MTIGVVAQDSLSSVVTVGNAAEMFARMKKIDRLFVRLKPFKKCPVIGCGVGDEPKVGSHFPNLSPSQI